MCDLLVKSYEDEGHTLLLILAFMATPVGSAVVA